MNLPPDSALTENTRVSYPIDYIENARIPCVGPHPKNIILLCCDAFGVLPPVSRLTTQQAMYHFISGYTAKVCLHIWKFEMRTDRLWMERRQSPGGNLCNVEIVF